ncbi:MAG: PEP/pyruvate-binding domain-containing protein [Syntrophobacteraceae bacterium]
MQDDRIESDALTRNLDLTNVLVEIPCSFEVLEEAVRGYAGKEKQARELLLEYHHKYRNWNFVVQETQRYAVGNLRLYRDHPLCGNVIYLLSRILIHALTESDRFEIRSLAADHLLAFWTKLAEEMPDALARPLPEGASARALEKLFETDTSCHEGILRGFFGELAELSDAPFEFLMRSFYPPKRLAGRLLKIWSNPSSFVELRAFMERFLRQTYLFWLDREDPCDWLEEQGHEMCSTTPWFEDCLPLKHVQLRSFLHTLDTEVAPEPDARAAVERLSAMTDFHDITHLYFQLPDKLAQYQDVHAEAMHIGMLMRLKVMDIKGLEAIHEETLREINFEIGRWISREPREQLEILLDRIFAILEISLRNYPQAALQIIRTIGMEILDTDERPLIEYFVRRIIRLGFQSPMLGQVSQHWQIPVNPAHLLNVRIWIDIIKKNPLRTRNLLSALIVNLSLGGIFVRDTDLFQKDVSQLLNTPMRPVYNLVKQLTKLFPVYFNQIGAEGQLRTVSTDVDEITGRNDRLIHFLRKQSHVESNNIVVSFMQGIIEYWRTMDKSHLEGLVPAEVYWDVPESGPLIEDIHKIFEFIFSTRTINHVQDLLDLSERESRFLIDEVPDVAETERKRAFLMIQFYQLLHEKYALSFKDIHVHLQRAAGLGLPDPGRLLVALESEDRYEKLETILDYLIELREVILTPGELRIMENIYYKRHIAVDIPSMYGSYNEPRFDALGLTFRLENLANVLFEEIIFSFNLSFITRATFFRIARFIPLFMKALEIDGITSNRLELQKELFMKALDVPRFSHSQFMDIFRGFSEAIKQIIQTNYDSAHDETLEPIIRQLGQDRILARYQRDGETAAERNQRLSESFLRELIARTFGLQYFDHFITSILTTLATQREELTVDKLDLLLSYDPEKTVSHIHTPNPSTLDLIYMGNKAHTLARLHEIGIKVPPGFVITTEYFRCRSVIESFSHSREDFDERVMALVQRVEADTGRKFGHPGNALLFSVRSGSAVSMPGMMNTFLNVGINEAIVEGLIAQMGQAWFAWDNYRRFIQSWAMSFGMPRDEFDAIMNFYKSTYGRKVKREFSPSEIREVATAYRHALLSHEIEFSDDPKEQLFTAIEQVVKSWDEQKAKTYREIMMLSENWGTAVTIQTMVFGNLDTHSGAGVMFTHNPWTSEDKVEPVGDFTWGNQGEDVVGGLVKTLPLSEKQRLGEGERKETSLEALFPRVYKRLTDIAKTLVYEQNWAPQEVEFTFQGVGEDGVFVLQSRNMTPRIKRSYPVFKNIEDLRSRYLGSGIGVSGGALAGMVAFDLETIQRLKEDHPGKPIILIRSDTVPDDIREISVADGILTGKGGATSHAAIVAHRLGKVCVVGVSRMRVWESQKKCVIDGTTLRTGDPIGIDGRSGAIYSGMLETEQVDVSGSSDYD